MDVDAHKLWVKRGGRSSSNPICPNVVCASTGCTLPLPAMGFYEPTYETGRAVRWRIGLAGGKPFAIAGLRRGWPEGAISLTVPTVNADSHPPLRRFNAPGKEKSGIVILPSEEWDDWLMC